MSTTAARTAPVWHAGHLFEFLLEPEETGGAMSMIRTTCRPGFTRGVAHAPRFDSDVVRCIVVLTPGTNAQLFREFSVPATELALPPLGEHLPDFEAMGRRMAAARVGKPHSGGVDNPRSATCSLRSPCPAWYNGTTPGRGGPR